MRVILSVKAVWAAAKDADVDENVWTISITTRTSRMDMDIYCGGGADVLGPNDVVGAADGAIWGGLLCILCRMVNCYIPSYILRWEVLSTG